MGNTTSDSGIVARISDDPVCLALRTAAENGNLDDVTKLLPLALQKGVLNQVHTTESCLHIAQPAHVLKQPA